MRKISLLFAVLAMMGIHSSLSAEERIHVDELVPADELTQELEAQGWLEEDFLAVGDEKVETQQWRRRPRPVRPFPPRRRGLVTCYARDARGRVYTATGRFPYRVENRALRQCERRALFCRSLGCR